MVSGKIYRVEDFDSLPVADPRDVTAVRRVGVVVVVSLKHDDEDKGCQTRRYLQKVGP